MTEVTKDVVAPKLPVEVLTITGMKWSDALAKLKETLPVGAYKKVPGGANLTDISPAYLREYLTICFGPYGVGWAMDYIPLSLTVEDTGGTGMNKYHAQIKAFKLVISVVIDGVRDTIKIPSAGSSNNSVWDYAANGAITSALGKAASYLMWQLPVYKGLTTHDTVAEVTRRETAERRVATQAAAPDALMGDDAIKVLVDAASKAGYDLSITRVRNALNKALGIPRGTLNKLTTAHGRIVYKYCKSQVGADPDAVEGIKEYGKAIANLAVEKSIPWEEAVKLYEAGVLETAAELGGEKA